MGKKMRLTVEDLKNVLDKTDSKHIGQYIGLLGMAVANGDISFTAACALFEELKLRYC